jgi:hypothetical protein
MKKLALLAALATVAVAPAALAGETTQSVREVTEAAGTVDVDAGKMLYSSSGHRIASVYRVTAEGNPQVILDGRLVTVPASTLSDVNGKLTTSLSKRDLARSR